MSTYFFSLCLAYFCVRISLLSKCLFHIWRKVSLYNEPKFAFLKQPVLDHVLIPLKRQAFQIQKTLLGSLYFFTVPPFLATHLDQWPKWHLQPTGQPPCSPLFYVTCYQSGLFIHRLSLTLDSHCTTTPAIFSFTWFKYEHIFPLETV